MTTILSDEDDHDIIAEYENEELDDQDDVTEEQDREEEDKENQDIKKKDDTGAKKQIVRNPVPTLNTERLKGPKGIQTIEKYFEGFKFYGKGHEKKDLDRIMKRLEHWSHRLFPKSYFDDFLARVEKLGNKRDLSVFIKKYRQDMITVDDAIVMREVIDDSNEEKEESEPIDEFDLLIAEQIEKQKQVTRSQEQEPSTSNASETLFDQLLSDTNQNSQPTNSNTSASQFTDEVKERIERNRQQAIQRRLARLQALKEEEEAKKSKLNTDKDIERIGADNENNISIAESVSMSQVSDTIPVENENMNSTTNGAY